MIFNTIFNYLILATIFFLPLIPMSFGRGYEEIKVMTFLHSTMLLSLFYILNYLINKQKIKFTQIHWALILFLLFAFIISITGINPAQSLLGAQPYLQGWITFLFLSLFSYFISVSTLSLKKISITIITSATLVSLMALFQYYNLQQGRETVTYAGRVVSTFGQPNFYAGFLLLTLPFVLYRMSQLINKEYILLPLMFAVIVIGIAVSFSRTAIIFGSILICFWLVHTYVEKKTIKIILVGIISAGILFALIPSRLLEDELIQPLTQQTVTFSNVQKRIYIWQVALEQIQKRPLLGYGLENIVTVYPKEFDFNHPQPAFYHSIKDLTIDNTHNLLFNMLLWGGAVLTLSFMVLTYLLWKTAKEPYLKMSLAIFLFWAIFQNLSIIHWLYFFILIGLIAQQTLDTKDHKIIQ